MKLTTFSWVSRRVHQTYEKNLLSSKGMHHEREGIGLSSTQSLPSSACETGSTRCTSLTRCLQPWRAEVRIRVSSVMQKKGLRPELIAVRVHASYLFGNDRRNHKKSCQQVAIPVVLHDVNVNLNYWFHRLTHLCRHGYSWFLSWYFPCA